ncbi:MAG TPA: chemotaxis protein CheB [Gemmatimonadaceae bacterium]|nr:chemotaxis protein CheB [Gemmatimonadaceae bacterium]
MRNALRDTAAPNAGRVRTRSIHSPTPSGGYLPHNAAPDSNATSPDHRFPVVGIGASAGGLAALRQFFGALPERCGMAFVVIVHLDPNEKSHMAELLQTHTKLRVRQVSRPLQVEADNVYVIPPDKDLTLSDGHFRLSARAMPNRSRAPIDGFFKTLADVHSDGAIGIVLSGTGSDGTQGVKWIKEGGGVTMAQLPKEAEYASMPTSAIATGYVDVVLPVAQLGVEALRLCASDPIGRPQQPEEVDAVKDRITRDILSYVRSKTDHDFSGYKHSTVNRRIVRRAQFAHAPNLSSYLQVLRNEEAELVALYNDLLISVTSFFRDPEAFAELESEVMPGLFANKTGTDSVRIWVTGCATGEEAYSMAIMLCEQSEKLPDPPQIQVFATDVHERGFALARDGVYPETIASDVTPERLERYFTREPGAYRIKKVVREKVIFAAHNLLRHPPFLRIDLVSCRNLLIYLQRDAQRRVLQSFHFALKPGGHLFLGTSESVEDVGKLFKVVNKKYRLFRSLDVARADVVSLIDSRPSDVSRQTTGRLDARSASAAAFSSVHLRLLEAYAPPSLVIGKSGQIVHFSESVGKYLHISGGEPSIQLADLLPGSVRSRVKNFIAQAFSKGERSELRGIDIKGPDKTRKIDLIARPLPGKGDAEQVALIVFEEVSGEDAPPPAVVSKARKPGTAATRQLEQELAETKAQLNVTVEEHDGAMEELKASNEELQSINEEQRATEEELEASKEELQSINEELHTVNQEFKIKNEELGERNSDLGNFIDSTGIATIFLDRALRVRVFTPAVSNLFHLRANDAGRPLADIAHKLDYPGLTEDATEVLRTLVRCDREVRAVDGRWYLARISPYRSVDDRIEGVVLSLLDISDRKKAEQEREKLLDEVQAASLAKSNFIGVMSHELRTPLNAIIGYADVLLAGAVGQVSGEQAWHLERVKASASHLAHMIDDSLQSVRIESGITNFSSEPVDVATIVREVASATEPLMTAKRLEFKINVEEGPPIIADATRIRQILFNLLGNAVRYTDSGSVSISSKVTEHGATITIEDTGIGISAENLEKIFERFWQVDQSKTRIRGGTGLGLMVSRSLARLMGGELDVTSELGSGSRFVVRLPSVPPPAAAQVSS